MPSGQPATNAEEIEQLQEEVIRLRDIVASLARRRNIELLPDRLATEDVIVYANAHIHEGDIIRRQGGDLLCAMREASEHISVDGKIVTVCSTDGGWT